MTATIDFLPAKYRDRDIHRKHRFSRAGVVVLFAGMLAAGSYALQVKRQNGAAELAVAQQRYEVVLAQYQTHGALSSDLQALRCQAKLIVFLKHPWSRTRLLSVLLEPWPAGFSLQELQIQQSPEGGHLRSLQRPAVGGPVDPSAPVKGDAQLDLEDLQREADSAPTVIRLTGLATDHPRLYQYLAQLERNELIRQVEPPVVDPADATGSLRFSVRITVAPGHGQSQRPVGPAGTPAEARRPTARERS